MIMLAPTAGATVAGHIMGFIPLWMVIMMCMPVVMSAMMHMWFAVETAGSRPQVTSAPTYIAIAPQPVTRCLPPRIEKYDSMLMAKGAAAAWTGACWILREETKELVYHLSPPVLLYPPGLPRLIEEEEEDVFVQCLGMRAKIGTVTREEVTPMVNQLIQKKDREPVRREAVTSGSALTLEKRLEAGFTKAEFSEGLKVFSRIKKEHDLLRPLLQDSGALNSLVNLKRIGQLTENLYLQGLSRLMQALDISEQLGQTNADTLEVESRELKEKLEGHEPGSTLHNMITERLEKNAKGLKTVKEHRDRMDEVLMEAGLCRDSMREIRLELPELVGHRSKDELEKVMLELRTRIDFAQRVHEEYTKQGL